MLCEESELTLMDAQRALLVVRRWWPLVVAGTLLAAVAAYGITKAQPKVYEATAVLQVYPGVGTIGGGGDFNEVQAAWYQAADDARLIATTDVALAAINSVGQRLSQPIDAGTLLQNTKAQSSSLSRVVTVAVRSGNADDASLLANAMADSFVAYNARSQTATFTHALAVIDGKMRYYSRDEADATQQSQRLALAGSALTKAQQARSEALFERITADQEMLTQLQRSADGIHLWLAGAGSSVSVAQHATTPTAPVSPRATTNTLIAAVLAFLVLTGIVLLVDFVDTRPRTAADVAAMLDLPLLGTISSSNPEPAIVADSASAQADEYRVVRANLGVAGHGDDAAAPARTLMVTGLDAGDGATALAANLAAVAARAGERVILIDANLRRPGLQALFGLPERGGLATLLRDGGDAEQRVQESRTPGLRVLTAGHNAADAIDLLGSTRMREVLASLRGASDLLVVDAAAATSADTRVLAPLADATILVARLRGAGREALVTAGQGLRHAGARLAGVVVMLAGSPASSRRAGVRGTADTELAGRVDPRTAK